MAAITFDEVSKVYPDGTRAVSAVDLEIADGSFMVLVGPSGCGKTTLLRMLAGLEGITGGTIRVGGRVVNNVPPKERDIAMVFQNYALYPHMSVFDNMAFALKLRRVPKPRVRERVDSTADILDLVAQLRKKPGMLSGGQRQRVAMGRAIVREPQAFLMDEPLSNLDAKLRVQMRAEIARIQRDLGVTTVYVTHDQIEAMTLGDRVAVLRGGVLQQVDAPQELFERPRNLFVAGFIGSPAMNLVEAALERSDGGAVVSFGSHRLRVPDDVFQLRPGLSRYVGRHVALGIRPDDFEDASLVHDAPADSRLSLEVDLRETLGREAYLHFTIDAPPVLTEDVRELAADTDVAAVEALEREVSERATRFVALVSAKTPAREGGRIELAVDTSVLHFFDRETGESIYEG
ncbi:MAG TPA: sn-glycerol-3-phosphate ABC transporter ATP-binding protein UgpC [Gaiellaceae bacterium]|jgi:multiple sugar transport system ATP-binding protein